MGFAGHSSHISTPFTSDAVKALNINAGSKYTVDEQIAIVEWVRLNKRLPNGKLPATPRDKVKRGELFSGFTRISFTIKSTTKRQHITLESEYIAALEKVAPDNRNQWLSETVDAILKRTALNPRHELSN